MGPEIVYVSGRVRPPGEMNGKSGNMNNCLGQIYPKEHRIPGNEVVCVFDADQVAKKDFFLKTLPFFDAGGSRGSHLSCALPAWTYLFKVPLFSRKGSTCVSSRREVCLQLRSS